MASLNMQHPARAGGEGCLTLNLSQSESASATSFIFTLLNLDYRASSNIKSLLVAELKRPIKWWKILLRYCLSDKASPV